MKYMDEVSYHVWEGMLGRVFISAAITGFCQVSQYTRVLGEEGVSPLLESHDHPIEVGWNLQEPEPGLTSIFGGTTLRL